MSELHEMKLIYAFDDGREWWYCEQCGRDYILSWPPNYHKEILAEGDIKAKHMGGKGGRATCSFSVEQVESVPDVFREYLEGLE